MPVTFGSACAISESMLYVAGFIDELGPDVAHTRLFVLNLDLPDLWFRHDLPGESVASVALRPATAEAPRACYALSMEGTVEVFNSSSTVFERIEGAGLEVDEPRGQLTQIRHIGTRPYACGASNQVYRREADGWAPIDHAIRDRPQAALSDVLGRIKAGDSDLTAMSLKLREYTVLHDIAGRDEKSIYACGSNGVVLHYDGTEWIAIESGTRQHLQAIHCVSDSDVLICGYNGTLIRGNHKLGFRRVPLGRVDMNFWAVQEFEGEIYLGTTHGLLQIQDGEVRVVEIDDAPYRYPVGTLECVGRVLWAVSDKFVLRLHDKCWQVVEHPDNA